MDDMVEYQGIKETIHNTLLRVTHNNHPLFTGVEKGIGKNKNKLYLLMMPKL